MNGLTFQEIISYLLPTPQFIVFDIFLYIIFFLALMAMFTLPDKNMVPTFLVAGVLLCCLVAKLSTAAIYKPGDPILGKKDFGMYAINVAMLVFPMIAVGTTRKANSKDTVRSTPFAILAGILGAVYFFLFWLVHQRV